MRFDGILIAPKQGEKYWAVSVPSLGIFSQGKSRADALFMICDAVEVAADRKGFKVSVDDEGSKHFSLTANDPKVLLSLLLERKRSEAGLSIREVARRLNMRSPNGYAKYEKGKINMSVDQFEKILYVIDPKAKVFLKVG
jgi:hypothetical protein